MRVALFLALTILGALGAVVAAATGASPAALGGALVLAFIGLAGAAAATAVGLHASDELREPREARGPTGPVNVPNDGLTRPVFSKMWFGVLGAFAVLGLVPVIALSRKPGRLPPTGWRAGVRLVDENNLPIPHDRLASGGIQTVFPLGGVNLPDAPAVLIRLPLDTLEGPGQNAGATRDGYVAFSKICTHAGCPVALYREQTHQLYCPCHQSRFDVLNGAANLSGPAPRPLPQLALGIDASGYLIARGDFNAPVGPDEWDRTP